MRIFILEEGLGLGLGLGLGFWRFEVDDRVEFLPVAFLQGIVYTFLYFYVNQ